MKATYEILCRIAASYAPRDASPDTIEAFVQKEIAFERRRHPDASEQQILELVSDGMYASDGAGIADKEQGK